jgi:hypothetical protein
MDYVARHIIQDDEQPVPARPGGADRPQRGQGVIGALVLAGDAPQLVIADAVAAVEVADAAGAVVGRAQPGRAFARRRAHAVTRPDGQRPELVKGEAPVRVMAGHVLDPVQLGVLVRIGGLLPGPRPLEADPAGVEDLPQPLQRVNGRPSFPGRDLAAATITATSHDLLQAPALLIGQPPRPHRLGHLASQYSTCHHKTECGSNHCGVPADPVNVCGQRTSRAG